MKSILYPPLLLLLSVPSLPLQAEPSKTTPAETAVVETVPEWHYSIDGKKANSQAITEQAPFKPLLTILKNSIKVATTKKKMVSTVVKLPTNAFVSDAVGALPDINIVTQVDDKGQGQSKIAIPAMQKKIKDEDVNGVIDFKGLKADVVYQGALKQAVAKVDLPYLLMQVNDSETNSELLIKEFKLAFSLDDNDKMINTDFSLPTFNFKDDETSFKLEKLSIKSDAKEVKPNLSLANSHMKMAKLAVGTMNNYITIEGMELLSQYHFANNLVSNALSLSMDKIQLPSIISQNTHNLKYQSKLFFHKLDADVLIKLQETINSMQKQYEMGLPPQLIGMSFFGTLVEIGPQLLKKSPEIELKDLKIQSDEGNMTGKMHIKFDGSQALDFNNPLSLLMSVGMSGQFNVDESLFKTVIKSQVQNNVANATKKFSEKEINRLVDSEIQHLVADKQWLKIGNQYRMSLRFADAELYINGQAIELPPSFDLKQENLGVEAPAKNK